MTNLITSMKRIWLALSAQLWENHIIHIIKFRILFYYSLFKIILHTRFNFCSSRKCGVLFLKSDHLSFSTFFLHNLPKIMLLYRMQSLLGSIALILRFDGYATIRVLCHSVIGRLMIAARENHIIHIVKFWPWFIILLLFQVVFCAGSVHLLSTYGRVPYSLLLFNIEIGHLMFWYFS